MELLKLNESPAELVWNGITFLYRTKVTVGDKFEIDTVGIFGSGDKIEFKKWDLCKALIRIFVVGWRGVTEGEKDAPYSYETLMSRLPADMASDLVLTLGAKIAEDTGLIASASTMDAHSDLKNG